MSQQSAARSSFLISESHFNANGSPDLAEREESQHSNEPSQVRLLTWETYRPTGEEAPLNQPALRSSCCCCRFRNKPASRTGQQRDRDRDRHPLTGPLCESSPGPLISSLLTKITIKTEEEVSALAARRHVGMSSCQSSCCFEETSESSERDGEAFTEQARHFYFSKDSPVNIFFHFFLPSYIPLFVCFLLMKKLKECVLFGRSCGTKVSR